MLLIKRVVNFFFSEAPFQKLLEYFRIYDWEEMFLDSVLTARFSINNQDVATFATLFIDIQPKLLSCFNPVFLFGRRDARHRREPFAVR